MFRLDSTRWVALVSALLLLAAACGGDDTAEGESGDEEAQLEGGAVADDAAAAALTSTTVTDDGAAATATPTSMEEWEALWAEERAAIVERIRSEGYGINDENILIGPAGFEIDLNNCPADWSDTPGLDGSILIGHTTTQSGNLAAYGNIAAGMEVLFDQVNANGGIGGVPIEMVVKDDGYVATQTIELIDELMQSEDPFMITTLGSPNTLAVYDTINDNCIPHPFAQTGHPAWGDPENHPWTTGLAMSYTTEAVFWGQWIRANMADQLPVKVAALVNDNDFGKAYGIGFERWAEQNPDVVSEFVQIGHDPAAATVTNEMTTIAAEDPDVFISMTAGNPCLLAVQEAGNNGLTESADVLFAPQTCKDPQAFMVPAGDAADGWWIVGGGAKTTTDSQFADEPYIAFVNDELAGAGLDPTVGLYGTGFSQYGWPYIHALLIASELDGGLTRTNFMLALRSMEMTHPLYLPGIAFSMNGNEDAYYVEGTEFARYDATGQTWVQVGDVVDLNGESPNCAWTESGCA